MKSPSRKQKNRQRASQSGQARRRVRHSSRVQKLESRNLLAAAILEGDSLTLTASDDSDTIQVSTISPGLLKIQVGEGDTIELSDAASSSPNLRVSADGASLEVRTSQSPVQGEGELIDSVFGAIDPVSTITLIGGAGDDLLSAEGVTERVLIIGE